MERYFFGNNSGYGFFNLYEKELKSKDKVVLLKGGCTVVAAPDGRTTLNATGNSGMATAGSGDVLTGIIGALLAQGLSGYDAARVGAFVHGRAGDLAAQKRGRMGLIAGDLVEFLPEVWLELGR